jgi:beta-N-acetylhexosaminidase
MRSLEHKIGQMLLVGFEGLHAPDYILDWLANGQVGGIILFSRNIATPEQVAGLTRTLHEAAREPILIAIDQEGGTVARLREGFTEAPSAMALGAADSEALAEQVAAALGEELVALGINLNLAPVVDLGHDSSNPVIGTRTFGVDEARVGKLACAQVHGYQQAGVAACAKHFPGHGNTPVDSHVSLPVISGPLDFLWQHDLVPFRATAEAGIASVMISHVKFEALDSKYPSTLSPAIITGLLRDEISFEGLAVTDCMEMKAITKNYGSGESAVLAALAGVDAMFFSHTREAQQAAYDALLAAARSGRLPEARIDTAVARVDAFKQQYPTRASRPLETIRTDAHLEVCRQGAEAGTVLIDARPGVFPLKVDDGRQIGLVEFASHLESGILDQGGLTGLGLTLQAAAPGIEHVALNSNAPRAEALDRARVLASEANVLVLATRNAHLNPAQRVLAQELLDSARNTILICLRNPYDVEVLTGADAVLCTSGDSVPSLQAAVDALLGRFTPSASLPVPVEGLPA